MKASKGGVPLGVEARDICATETWNVMTRAGCKHNSKGHQPVQWSREEGTPQMRPAFPGKLNYCWEEFAFPRYGKGATGSPVSTTAVSSGCHKQELQSHS